jgi:hypothetical protein
VPTACGRRSFLAARWAGRPCISQIGYREGVIMVTFSAAAPSPMTIPEPTSFSKSSPPVMITTWLLLAHLTLSTGEAVDVLISLHPTEIACLAAIPVPQQHQRARRHDCRPLICVTEEPK